MKKRYLLFTAILAIFFFGIGYPKVYAEELDRIENMTVTVDPRMTDASLDIQYEITWKVLDSTTEGPLTWVRIGTPNEYFDNATALSDNIEKIDSYSGSYVRIDFKRPYEAGESLTFKYSIHQRFVYKLSGSKCKFEFTPAWFTDSKVDNLTIRWNADSVKKSNHKAREGNYLIWNKKNLEKGEKLKAKITYKKSAFPTVTSQVNRATLNRFGNNFYWIVLIVSTIAIIVVAYKYMDGGKESYYGHRGFYYNGRWNDGPMFVGRRMCSPYFLRWRRIWRGIWWRRWRLRLRLCRKR